MKFLIVLLNVLCLMNTSFAAKLKDCDLTINNATSEKDVSTGEQIFNVEFEGTERNDRDMSTSRAFGETKIEEIVTTENRSRAMAALKTKCEAYFKSSDKLRKFVCVEDLTSNIVSRKSSDDCNTHFRTNCFHTVIVKFSMKGSFLKLKDAAIIQQESCNKAIACFSKHITEGGFSKKEYKRITEYKNEVCGVPQASLAHPQINDSQRNQIKDVNEQPSNDNQKAKASQQ